MALKDKKKKERKEKEKRNTDEETDLEGKLDEDTWKIWEIIYIYTTDIERNIYIHTIYTYTIYILYIYLEKYIYIYTIHQQSI